MRTPRPWVLPQQPAAREHLRVPGVTPAMIETRIRTGDLMRVRPGVYLDAARWPADQEGRHLVRAHAEQVAHPGGVLSHQTAALTWALPCPDLTDWAAGPVSLSLPRSGAGRAPGSAVLHRPESLPPHHVTRDREGYQVTTVARTAVDLAKGLPLPEALILLDAAARQLCEALVVAARRSDFANPRLVRAARDTLSEVAATCRVGGLGTALGLTDPCRESPIESLTAGHLHLSGLPTPLFQAAIRTPRGVFYPDCLWPGERLIGEADGAGKYADKDARVREKEREQVLRDLDYRFVRWLGREIRFEPQVVMARIARALDQ